MDHKPDGSEERQRIEDVGGFVMWAGTWRVGGVLVISRAFDDKLLKQYVVSDPDIKVHQTMLWIWSHLSHHRSTSVGRCQSPRSSSGEPIQPAFEELVVMSFK